MGRCRPAIQRRMRFGSERRAAVIGFTPTSGVKGTRPRNKSRSGFTPNGFCSRLPVSWFCRWDLTCCLEHSSLQTSLFGVACTSSARSREMRQTALARPLHSCVIGRIQHVPRTSVGVAMPCQLKLRNLAGREGLPHAIPSPRRLPWRR